MSRYRRRHYSYSDCESEDENTWDLGNQKKVSISVYNRRTNIDIRNYYPSDGQTLPTKYGIGLSTNQWKKLLSIADEINRSLKPQNDSTIIVIDSDSDDAPPPNKKPKKSKSAKKTSKDDEHIWVLEYQRKVRVLIMKTRGGAIKEKLVDIRDFNLVDGQSIPDKWGVKLKEEQWTNLLAVADQITLALENF